MTISLRSNASDGAITLNSFDKISITANGLPFMRNILINGEVTRINQRGVANWAAVSNGAYGYDRWKKVDASNMTQIIEDGNYRYNTVYTLSGNNVATQQLTSPASGHWTLPNIDIAATNIQLEEGTVATPFEKRNLGFELALCQRYYEVGYITGGAYFQTVTGNATDRFQTTYAYKTTKRVTPSVALVNLTTGSVTVGANTVDSFSADRTGSMSVTSLSATFTSSAEL